jgi:DNA-binding FadR family transcriptional regulator
MCHDRLDGDDLPLKHEFIALMLGVRRAGVTEALNILEKRGIIQASRGNIVIVDRVRLEETAGDSYGVPEAEYRRLIAPELSACPTRMWHEDSKLTRRE